MALSQYDLRQDALAFLLQPQRPAPVREQRHRDHVPDRVTALNANDFDYSEILDVQLVLYYDGFFQPHRWSKQSKPRYPSKTALARLLHAPVLPR